MQIVSGNFEGLWEKKTKIKLISVGKPEDRQMSELYRVNTDVQIDNCNLIYA